MPNATDGQLSSAWYCGAECQKAHWTEHKVECKAAQARRALYRAGALAQQLFYRFSATTYSWCPGRIEKIGTTWLIHPRVYTGTSVLIPFQYEIVADVHDQEALLTYQTCSSAVSNMHDVVKALLGGKWSLSLLEGARSHTERKQVSTPRSMESLTLSKVPNTT